MNNLYDKERFSDKYGFGEHKQEAIELLKKTIDILNEFDIKYFIISGTLLGYVRHKDIIPWDDDIDLIVDKNIIEKAVSTIDNWQTLCDQGVSIALTNNTDMVYLKQTNQDLKQKSVAIKTMNQMLAGKCILNFAKFNLCLF